MSNHLIERNLPSWKINDATKVNEFTTCPRKYFYSYVLGWRSGIPSNHLVFGTSWHIAMEYLLTHDYSINSVIKAHEEFLSDYRKTFGPETDELFWPKTPDNALIALNAYAKQFAEDLKNWEPLYTEIAGKININDEQILHFRMDSIMKHRFKEKVKSIEHKTGSMSYNWELQWPLSMQNGTYSHVLYCLFPTETVEGVTFRGSIFKKSKKGWEQLLNRQPLTVQPPYEFVEFPARKSPEQMNTWLWNTQLHLDQIAFNFELLGDCREDEEVLYAFPLYSTSCTKYFGCEFLDFCQAWQNPLQRCFEPPLGFIEEHWDPSAKPAKKVFEIGETKDEPTT